MIGERVANRIGADGAAAERDGAASGRIDEPRHDLRLAAAELRLAVGVEERGDRLAELALELLVRIDGLEAGVARSPEGSRLARAHEADEDEGAVLGAQRRHPMRSR